MTSKVKERLHELIESAPDKVLDDIEDILPLIETKGKDEGTRIPWEKAREELDIEES